MDVARAARTAWAIGSLLVVESVVFGLSAVPALLTWRFLLNLPFPLSGKYFETALLGVAFVPSYLAFCVALMALSAVAARAMRWRAVEGRFPLAERGWPLVRWAQYNACIHLVRVFAGPVLRSTPLWTSYVRFNGGRVGRNVHINTVAIYDHNLLTLGDHVVLGSDVKISAHSGGRGALTVAAVALGRRVTVGTNSIVQPGVEIGDETQVAPMSLVPKGSRLEPRCVYGGVPVELLKRYDAPPEPRPPPGGATDAFPPPGAPADPAP